MGEKRCGLASMHPGEHGRIAGMHVAGDIGQRLKDMGFVRGAGIECVYASPFGDPVAYFVKGTLIAVRNEDAQKIEVKIIETEMADVEKTSMETGDVGTGGAGQNGSE